MPDLAVDRDADDLAHLFELAEARLQALVAQALGSGDLGTLRYRKKRLAAVTALLKQLKGDYTPQANALAETAYVEGAKIADPGIVGDVTTFGSAIDVDAVAVLQDNLTNELDGAIDRVGRRVDDLYRREGLRAAATGILTGESRREASQALVTSLQDRNVEAFVDVAGRRWNLDTYARMAIRTITREAVTVGTRNRLLQQGMDLVEISLHLNACKRCVAAYRGKTFSLTGHTPGFPILKNPPPLHPNDRCVMRGATNLALESLERELGLLA